PPPPPGITSSGEGEVILAPNRALLRLGVEVRSATAAEASSHAGRRARAVRDAIHALGFPPDSIRTVSFNVGPTYDYQRSRKPVDYRAAVALQLKLRSLDQIGAVLDTALAAGTTEVPTIGFDSDSIPAARSVALGKAVQQARADADVIARAAGGTLGRLLTATTSEGPRPGPFRLEAMTATPAGAAPDVS